MKDGGRIQAVIEILGEIFKDTSPADQLLDRYFKERRYIGAKDRRYIADTVWSIIRHRQSLSERLAVKDGHTPSARLMVALWLLDADTDLELFFSGDTYTPEELSKDEREALSAALNRKAGEETTLYECPKWLVCKITDRRLLAALNATAPVDVRANLLTREQAKERLYKEGLFFSATPFSPIGLRSQERFNLNNCMTYQDGGIEVMDEGSQLLALLADVKGHHKVIDYCAGAGGKALAIASLLNNDVLIEAHDINKERLGRIKKRAERLGIDCIKTVSTVTDTDYARFIIDAPCSGSGTWRRSPDAKFRLTEERLLDICRTQAELLEFGATHVKIGGRLIYMTCSVLREENEQQIEDFLIKHPEFTPINHQELWQQKLEIPAYPFLSQNWLHFSPLNTKTDGFFFAALKKIEN